MSTHKDLPTGSGKWAADIDAQLRKLQEIEAVARRLCNDFGIDYANPQRGINTGPTPSAQNPVQLKLPSLRDLDIRDAQDGDLLTFDGTRGVWVARRHDTVQLPKEFPQGDPDSYYTPVPVPSVEGIWSDTLVQTITTEEGKRVNTIKVQPDGSLKLSVELSSIKFKTPIRYTLSFAKGK